MGNIKTIIGTIAIGCLLTLLHLLLMTLPSHTTAKAAVYQSASDQWQVMGGQPTTSTTYVAPLSTTMRFGAIEVVTSVLDHTDMNALAYDLALAMDINASDIESAAFMCDPSAGGCTNPAAAAVLGLAPGTWFPVSGTTFALLSTGLATDVVGSSSFTLPIKIDGVSELQAEMDRLSEIARLDELGALHNSLGNDLVRLHLTLRVPPEARCLSFDFTFYTVDIPTIDNACVDNLGDTFTTQFNTSTMEIQTHGLATTLITPGNFALNQEYQYVSTTTMSPTGIYQALTSPWGSTIPGIFPLLQARHVVTPGERIDLYFSIQDMGDSHGNSAVALDHFRWLKESELLGPEDCLPGGSGDTDGDGLPNGWEEFGVYSRDKDGTLQHIDLKAMGANPTVKDIFVELDAMEPLDDVLYDPTVISQAITYVIDAFARAPVDPITTVVSSTIITKYKGIQLHVDYGSELPVPAQLFLCDKTCTIGWEQVWDEFDHIKREHFAVERSPVFHYGLFAYQFVRCNKQLAKIYVAESSQAECKALEGVSGASRNIKDMSQGASDFVVTLGAPDWFLTGIVTDQQAGTFMHELGHNLGLNHFGTPHDTIGEKPNHLSVMNYLYQTKGLVVDDPRFRFDYQRFNMPTLDENALNESTGLGLPPLTEIDATIPYTTIGVRHYCRPSTRVITVTMPATKVDWDCIPPIQETDFVSHNISGDFDENDEWAMDKLTPLNEWDKLTFTGGLLNRQRSIINPTYYSWRPSLCHYESDSPSDDEVAPPFEPPKESPRHTRLVPPKDDFQPPIRIPEELTPHIDKVIPQFLTPINPPETLDQIGLRESLVRPAIPVWHPDNVLPGIGVILEMLINANDP